MQYTAQYKTAQNNHTTVSYHK